MLRLVNTLWLLLFLSLILIAVYVSLGRHFLSVATDSPEYVQEMLEQVLDQPVQIRSVQGHWHFLSPSIALHDIRLGEGVSAETPGDTGLHVGFLHLGVDVFRTLLAREVRLSFLHVSGLKVGIYAANGRIDRIEGLNMFKPQAQHQTLPDQAPKTKSAESNALLTRVPRLLQNLLAYKGLIFKEIQVTLHTPKQSQKFLAKQLSLVEVAGQYHIQAELELLEGRPVVMSLHSIMQGRLMTPDTWSGRFYADIDRTPAARWLQHLPMLLGELSGELSSLDLGGALWGEFDAASVRQLTGRVALYALDYAFAAKAQQDLIDVVDDHSSDESTKTVGDNADEGQALASAPSRTHVKLPYAATQFNWRGEVGGNWKMRLQEIQLQSGANMFKPGPIYVTRTLLPNPLAPEPEPTSTPAELADALTADVADFQKKPLGRFVIQGQDLDIRPIAQLIQDVGVLSEEKIEQLKLANPQGRVSQFEVSVRPEDGALYWSAFANLADLQWGAVASLPGMSALNLKVAANESGGAAWVDIKNGSLDLRPNFREQIPLDHVSVPLRWEKRETGLELKTGVALLNNEDATATAMLALTVPAKRQKSTVSLSESEQKTMENVLTKPRLSLVAGLTLGTEKASASRYLPTKNMPPALVRWLDKSLVSGLLESGHFVHEGPFAKDPYGAKTFQMRFIANNAHIDYQPPWPAVTQARVDAFINRRAGNYIVPYAKAYDAEITNANIVMPYFEKGAVPRLKIDLKASGGVDQGLRILRESPLRKEVETFIDDLEATGDMALDLALDVPLGRGKEGGGNKKADATASSLPSTYDDPSNSNLLAQDTDSQPSTQANVAGEQIKRENADELKQIDGDQNALKADDSRPKLPVLADVTVHLKSVNAKMPPWKLAVDDVNGPFKFKTGKGIFSEGLTGRFLGKPVTAEIQPQPLSAAEIALGESKKDTNTNKKSKTKRSKTQISVTGSASAESVLDWQGLPILSFLSGEAGYRALVTLFPRHLKKAPNLTVQTDLAGIAVDLPEPIGKASEASADFSLSFDFGKPRHVSLLSKSQAAMGLRFNAGALDAVRIQLGAESPVLAQTPGVVITGDTPTLYFAPWIEFIERYQTRAAKSSAGGAAKKSASAPSADADVEGFDWLEQLKWVDISANALGYSDKIINQATVQVARIADVWQVTLQGAEISGIVSLPMQYLEPDFLDRFKTGRTSANVRERMNARPITLDIGFLGLPAAATESEALLPDYVAGPRLASDDDQSLSIGESDADSLADTELPVLHDGYRRLPPFNLKLRRLFRGGTPWGAWSAQARVTPLGLNFENIKGGLHDIVFNGQGAWTASLGGPATSIIGRAFSQNLAGTLEGLGFAPSIDSANATLDVDLKWQGRPWDFDLLTAGGDLEIAVTDGTLLNINSTASTLRVVGLLNIEMLTRRMQLDFSDVLNKGMQFQLLGGKFDLREGLLLTDHIKLRGASAQFDISGQVNLRAKTIDKDMSVTLPVTRNLVLPAAATGGLPAAATAFVIEKALGDKLDKLTTMRFNVEGDWNDPQITRKRRQVGPRDNRPGR